MRRSVYGRRWVAGWCGALALLAGCSRQVVSTESSLPGGAPRPSVGAEVTGAIGAATARGAVEGFLKAVNAQDLQTMSTLWGNAQGLVREQIKREDLEKRLVVIQCLLQHDSFRYTEDRPRLSSEGRQQQYLEIVRGSTRKVTHFTLVASRGGRWVVENIDVGPLQELCR
ncbi:MAG: hypothetical protein LCH84_13010 [Gemmatimonadetes bacterium]|nr:hypothetical protein [Gemmatimonadota bacterium]